MKTILYIEDDASLHQLIQFILQRRDDFRLLQADTGAAGLRLARRNRPDIILLDLSLPDMSGYDVLHQLRENDSTASIPVYALSGNSLPEDIAAGLAAGFLGYLTKPISVTGITSLLDAVSGSAQRAAT